MREPTNGVLGKACQRNCDVARDLVDKIMKDDGDDAHVTETLLDIVGGDHARKVEGEEANQDAAQV